MSSHNDIDKDFEFMENDRKVVTPKPNGATEVKVEELTIKAMFEVLAEAQAQLQESIDELNTKQDIILEKLENLSLDNEGFSTYD